MIKEMTRKEVLSWKKLGCYNKLVAQGRLRVGTKRAVFSSSTLPYYMVVMFAGNDKRMTVRINQYLPYVYLPHSKDYNDIKRIREEAMNNIV